MRLFRHPASVPRLLISLLVAPLAPPVGARIATEREALEGLPRSTTGKDRRTEASPRPKIVMESAAFAGQCLNSNAAVAVIDQGRLRSLVHGATQPR